MISPAGQMRNEEVPRSRRMRARFTVRCHRGRAADPVDFALTLKCKGKSTKRRVGRNTPTQPSPIEGEGYLSGAAAPDAGVGATLFVKELGEALEHDAAQLLGVDDRHGAAVVSGHVVADADRSELDLAQALDVVDHWRRCLSR